MRIVLTNDDGIDAPGLTALREAAESRGEVIIVAPRDAHSGGGHRVTTNEPILVQELGDRRFSVSGTPADCVRLALHELAPDADLVLAGINAGGNLGVDIYMSGTVAAARESLILGLPSIAISQYRRRSRSIDWKRAAAWTRRVLEELLPPPGQTLERAGFWNVNLPDPEAQTGDAQIVRCPVDTRPMPVSYRPAETPTETDGCSAYVYAGDYHQRPRLAGSDVDHCMAGRISITKLEIGS